MGGLAGWQELMSEDMSGKQLAEVLKTLAVRVQSGLDDGADIIEQLKMVAQKLEDKNAR